MLKILYYLYLCSASAPHLDSKAHLSCARTAIYAAEHNLDPLEIIALSYAESRHTPGRRSSAGARGVLQALPKYWKCKKPLDYDYECGAFKAWRHYRKRSKTPLEAVGKYNGGGTKTRYARDFKKVYTRLQGLPK